MFTLLLVITAAKVTQSLPSEHIFEEEMIVDTVYGKETLRMITHRHPHHHCNSSWKNRQENVTCKPRDRIIPLGPDFKPNAIIVKRCEGTTNSGKDLDMTCSAGGCVPSQQENIAFQVLRINGQRNCVKFVVLQDVSCHCKSENKESCEGGKSWNNIEDRCVCNHKLCTTGTRLDPNSCSCRYVNP